MASISCTQRIDAGMRFTLERTFSDDQSQTDSIILLIVQISPTPW